MLEEWPLAEEESTNLAVAPGAGARPHNILARLQIILARRIQENLH